MTPKDKLLGIKTYEEFDKRREEFKDVKFDNEMLSHLDEILGPIKTTDMELSRTIGGPIGG